MVGRPRSHTTGSRQSLLRWPRHRSQVRRPSGVQAVTKREKSADSPGCRSKAQQTARHCANEYWTELSETIQSAAIAGNTRGMYDGIKTAMGPVQNKTAPLKSTIREVITDKGQQMERWVGHYSDLYSRQNVVTTAALDAIKCLPVMVELDTEPTIEELSKAIESLASGKAPGTDRILPDLIKHCKTTLLLPLHEVLCQCWKEGAVPQEMRDAKIITLYKNKGERSDCNSERGISLLSIVGKAGLRSSHRGPLAEIRRICPPRVAVRFSS